MRHPFGLGTVLDRRTYLRRTALLGIGSVTGALIGCAPAPPPQPQATAVPQAPPTAAPKTQPPAAPTSAAPATKKPLRSVGLRMGWRLIGYFAPFRAAVDKGFFAEQGLDVKLYEGTGSGPALQIVANGDQPIGFVDGVVMTQGVQKGIDVRMVGCMFQRNIYAILSPKDAPLAKAQDFAGKKLAGTPGSVPETLWPAFAKKLGIDINQVTFVTTDIAGKYAALLSRKVDGAFHGAADTMTYEAQNLPVHTLLYADIGLDSLGLGIVATNKTLREDPDLIRSVLAAMTKAWTYAVEHPTETAALAKKGFESNLTEATLEQQWKVYQQFQRTARTKDKPLFWMDKQDWESHQSALHEVGFLSELRPVEAYYTNDFLPKG